ncbi:MAG: helix-turn-helix transcriptional regulator [Christensenellaceae bacterium]|nr:helix-turn-helix transcriptional regulator [Christensenellaceae bacterium]
MSDYQKHLQESLQNPEFAEAYNDLEAQYAFAREVIAARIAGGITQAELAQRVGTSQANISKIEHGTLNPSLALVQRIASGLGKSLFISLK